MAMQFFVYILFILLVKASNQQSQQIDLFEINEVIYVDITFKTSNEQLAQNLTLQLSNFGNIASYVFDKSISPKGFNTTNITKNTNKADGYVPNIHAPFIGSITIGNNQFDNYQIFVMKRMFGPFPYGVLDLVSLEDQLPSKMWTIYFNGNDSKLTLGDLDTENCENNYYWFDYETKEVETRARHPKVVQKIINTNVEIHAEMLENITIAMMDINDDKVVVPQRFIDSIKKIPGIIYNEETKKLNYNCNMPIPIKLHLSKNKIFEFNLNEQYIYNDDECFFKVFVGNDNNLIQFGIKQYFFEKCLAANIQTHQIGFSKKINNFFFG